MEGILSKGDTARTMYESARAELISRIQLRDNVLLVFMGAVGTVMGVALGTTARVEILFVVPFLAFGAATIVSQHNAVIGSLADFCVRELSPFLKSIGELAPQWDDSNALQEYRNSAIRLRSWGHTVIVVVPGIAALGLNWQHALKSAFPNGVLWWFGAVFVALAIWEIGNTHFQRKRIYDKFTWSPSVDSQREATGSEKDA